MAWDRAMALDGKGATVVAVTGMVRRRSVIDVEPCVACQLCVLACTRRMGLGGTAASRIAYDLPAACGRFSLWLRAAHLLIRLVHVLARPTHP